MQYFEIFPSKPLQAYINCYWYYENQLPKYTEAAIPDACVELIFHLGDRVKRVVDGVEQLNPRSNIIGPMSRPYNIIFEGNIKMIGVRFFPQTAYAFLSMPMAELNDQVLFLETIWSQKAAEIEEQLNQEGLSIQHRIHIIEAFLIKHLSTKDNYLNASDYIDYAVQTIIKKRGKVHLQSLAEELKISKRYLEKLFQSRIGLSPKEFSQIIQFQYTFKYLHQHPNSNLTELAYAGAYADQSHFIRICKKLTGKTPKHFFQDAALVHEHFRDASNQAYLFGMSE